MTGFDRTGAHPDELNNLEFRLNIIEKALNEQKDFFEKLIQYSAVATFVVDTEHRVLYWNRACEELTGIHSSEIIGTNDHWKAFYEQKRPTLADIVIDENFERLSDYYATYGKSSLIANGLRAEDWYPDLPAGKRYIIFDAAPVYNSAGKISAAVETLQDITALKHYEEELLKLQKLESIGLLAGGIAHDFNNLLTSILGNITLAKMYSGPSGQVFERLAEAEKVSMKARYLSNQLITFAKGGAPFRKTVSIAGLLTDSTNFMLSGSNTKCEFSLPEDLWLVEIDEEQISRVIHNIVVNADQAMPEGGLIYVKAENTLLDKQGSLPLQAGKYIHICIKDQGIGIPKDLLNKIFDPYFTTKQKGSGFGLAIAYSIIRKHNGIITVESEPGAGATFCIYLPASEKDLITEKYADRQYIKDNGKILVMDDEEIVRDVTGMMLCHIGYEVAFAEDGAKAIALYKKARESGQGFDAVIMDLTIPGGMGGLETLKLLKEIDPEIKAIVSSGYSTDPIMADFKRYGFSGVLAKPFHNNELTETVYSVLRGLS